MVTLRLRSAVCDDSLSPTVVIKADASAQLVVKYRHRRSRGLEGAIRGLGDDLEHSIEGRSTVIIPLDVVASFHVKHDFTRRFGQST
jgi:hypothetical protein